MPMKIITRVFFGLLGLIAIYFGIQQMKSGVKQLSGPPMSVKQNLGEPVVLDSHSCLLRVPTGWEQKPSPGGGVMFVAPKTSGYSANFIILSQPWAKSLNDYADGNIAGVKSAVPSAEMGVKAPFTLDSAAESVKVSLKSKNNALELGQSMYFFEGRPGQKIVITSTAPLNQHAELEPLFDSCMKTLVVIPPTPK